MLSGKYLREMLISQDERLSKGVVIKGLFLKISAQKTELYLIRDLE